MKKSHVDRRVSELPVVAILRGIQPTEALDIGTALYDAGIRVMEVTLNSPNPLQSIESLTSHFDGKMAIGAGTVTSTDQVDTIHGIGGEFIVSPNTNINVISRTAELGMYSLPGVATCTECFQAIEAGADALKIFPAVSVGYAGIKNLSAVLPKHIGMYAVGGVDENNMAEWLSSGAVGVGLGSNIYQAGDTPKDAFRKAALMVKAYEDAKD